MREQAERKANAAKRRPNSNACGYGRRWRRLRLMVLARDPICMICHERPSTDADHIVAKARGGSDELSNLQGLCGWCHDRYGSRSDRNWKGDMRIQCSDDSRF